MYHIKKNENMDKLRKDIRKAYKDDRVTKEEKSKIKNEYSEEVIAMQQADEIDEAISLVEKLDISSMKCISNDTDEIIKEKEYHLKDGGKAKIVITDEAEKSILSKGDYTVNIKKSKNYGNRLYTATLYIEHALYPDTELVIYFYLLRNNSK